MFHDTQDDNLKGLHRPLGTGTMGRKFPITFAQRIGLTRSEEANRIETPL
jgi:hypothetical protein